MSKRITIPLAGQYGVVQDAPSAELPLNAWSDALNFRFRDGCAERFTGQRQIFDTPSVTPYFLIPYQTSAARYFCHAGTTKVFVNDGNTETEITRDTEGVDITSITHSFGTATVTTSSAHGRTTSDTVTIYGATPDEYNGTYVITVTGATTFTYTPGSAPSTSPATLVGQYYVAGTSNFTGVRDNRWTGGTLGGVLLLNNGVDAPQYWGGDTSLNLRRLPGWPSTWRAKVIVPFKGFIVALGITKAGVEYPNMVKWSTAAEPGAIPLDWDSTDPTNDAGEQDLAETPDLLIDAKQFGDTLIIYKERSMYVMRQTFDARIFSFQRLPGEVGALGIGCVADTPIGHVVLGAGDVYSHRGQGVESIINGQMRRYLFRNIDSTNYARACVVANLARNEVWIAFPEVGQDDLTQALVFNWIDRSWAIREIPNASYLAAGLINYAAGTSFDASSGTFDSDTNTFNQDDYTPADSRLLMAMTAPRIDICDTENDFNLVSYTATLTRTNLPLDGTDRVKLMKALIPRIDADAGTQVQIEFGGSMDAEVAPTWSSPVTYTVGTSYKADSFASGRFLAVRFTSLEDKAFRIKSYDIEYELGGYY